MTALRLGMIGLSEGNGHPYSWAAIFNGYNPELMAKCPFPVIPEYLSRQEFPAAQIPDARVTHIWTQDRATSETVAKASFIQHVVDEPLEFLGQVDAVLLARDDAENHYAMSKPFLEAGLPIYIDKPIAYSLDELRRINSLAQYPGQIFTCSALRYAKELMLDAASTKALGDIQTIDAQVPKQWKQYAIHMIEPVLLMLPPNDVMTNHAFQKQGSEHQLIVNWQSEITTTFTATGVSNGLIQICVRGKKGEKLLTFSDTFAAFKSALQAFVETVHKKRNDDDPRFIERTIQLVEMGCG